MAKNLLQINIKEGDADSTILAEFLRTGAISSRAIEALSAFFFSLAVADNPDSTKEDIRKAEHYCLSKLKGHMCFLMDKHSRDSDIKIEADDFATVMINPPMDYGDKMWASKRSGKSMMPTGDLQPDRPGAETKPSHPTYSSFCRTVDGLEMIGFEEPPSFRRTENGAVMTAIDETGFISQEALETVGQILSRDNQERSDEIDREIEDRSSTPPEPPSASMPEEDEDDDYDPDDDLTDEEYSAKLLARIPNRQMPVVD